MIYDMRYIILYYIILYYIILYYIILYYIILYIIYLLTAIGLPYGGSIYIYTQTIHRTTQNKQIHGTTTKFWKSDMPIYTTKRSHRGDTAII